MYIDFFVYILVSYLFDIVILQLLLSFHFWSSFLFWKDFSFFACLWNWYQWIVSFWSKSKPYKDLIKKNRMLMFHIFFISIAILFCLYFLHFQFLTYWLILCFRQENQSILASLNLNLLRLCLFHLEFNFRYLL